MPTPTKGPRLGGGPAHERLILANLAQSLFEHDSITTTEAKAKRLRPLAERLVTFAKRGDLHARRRVLSVISDKGVVHRLFTEIAPDMAERPGGYTRITKIGARKGDNAPMAVIELVREPLAKKATVKEAEAATKRSAKQAEAKEAAVETKAAEDEAKADDHRGDRDHRGWPSSCPRVPSPRTRTARPPTRPTPSRATPTPASTTRPTASGSSRRTPSSGSSPPPTPRPLASPRPAPDPGSHPAYRKGRSPLRGGRPLRAAPAATGATDGGAGLETSDGAGASGRVCRAGSARKAPARGRIGRTSTMGTANPRRRVS